MVLEKILQKIDADRQRHVDELLEFLRIPSVSTIPRHGEDVRRAARWVSDQLGRLGLQAQIHETEGHPVVYGHRYAHGDRPILLIYGHYDVQPSDPDEEWATPPFAPSIRDGFIYARGASDDKGQLFTYLKAIEAVRAVAGELPVNVEIMVEGEEEIGSPHLETFLRAHAHEIKARAVAISDGSKFSAEIPAITYGLRGLSYLQLDVQGPRSDLHSGSLGGLVANPVQALAAILAHLKGEDGRVAIPGFYDDVAEPEAWERREMAVLPFDENELKDALGVEALVGESGYTPWERKTVRPTLDVNGIWGGFSGQGAKTVIPAKAGAKVSMRLVPNQSRKKIDRLFEKWVRSSAPAGVRVAITELEGAEPVLVSRDRPEVQAAARAIEIGFGKTPVFIREGGSIPTVNHFREILGLESIIMMGWGNPDDKAHAPNERFSLQDFHRGIRSAAAFLYEPAV